jgi:small basic protein
MSPYATIASFITVYLNYLRQANTAINTSTSSNMRLSIAVVSALFATALAAALRKSWKPNIFVSSTNETTHA